MIHIPLDSKVAARAHAMSGPERQIAVFRLGIKFMIVLQMASMFYAGSCVRSPGSNVVRITNVWGQENMWFAEGAIAALVFVALWVRQCRVIGGVLYAFFCAGCAWTAQTPEFSYLYGLGFPILGLTLAAAELARDA